MRGGQDYNLQEEGEGSSVRTEPHRGGGSGLGLGLARSGAGNPPPLQGERDAPVPFQAGQQSEHGGSLAQGTFPQLPQELARGPLPLSLDFGNALPGAHYFCSLHSLL